MAKLYVIQTGRTTWEEQARVESAAGAPLTAEAADELRAHAEELADCGIIAVYAGPGDAEAQTAALVAEVLGVKVKTRADLREIDYGLWQGLTVDEIKRRQPKVYRKWTEAPGSVRPPDGETLAEAQERLRRDVKQILQRHRGGPALVVLRPVMLGLLRCALNGEEVGQIWNYVDPSYTWSSYEADAEML